MGAACQACDTQAPERFPPAPPVPAPAPVPVAAAAAAAAGGSRSAQPGAASGGATRGGSLPPLAAWAPHDGARRAELKVKDGGFALKNIQQKRFGKIEVYYELEGMTLAQGTSGSVRRARDRRSGLCYAVKSLDKTRAKGGKGAVLKHERLYEEVDILRNLDHPNVMRLNETFEDRRRVYLVLELCEGGELFEHICQEDRLTEQDAAACVRQMMSAVNYLHQNRVAHRNLRPGSWLVASQTPEVGRATLKLTDFGRSRCFRPEEPMRTRLGQPTYMAPEMILGQYSEKVDLWSLGVVAYIMLSGAEPFGGRTSKRILERVQFEEVQTASSIWRHVSDTCKGFIKSLLLKNAKLRPSAWDALQYPWLQAAIREPRGLGLASVSSLDVAQLKAFSNMHKIKKAALTVIATQLTDERIEGLRALFVAMDGNGDGTVAAAELRESLRRADVALPHDLEELVRDLDTDGSGVIDYTEFLAATLDWKWCHQEEVVWAAFNKFDRDGSGTIDRREMARVLGDSDLVEVMHLEGDGLSRVFAQVDVNGDGVVDFEEIFAMMRAAERSRTQQLREDPAYWPPVVRRAEVSSVNVFAGGEAESEDCLRANPPAHYVQPLGQPPGRAREVLVSERPGRGPGAPGASDASGAPGRADVGSAYGAPGRADVGIASGPAAEEAPQPAAGGDGPEDDGTRAPP